MLPNNEMHALRDQWVVEAAPDGLADRISRHALAQKQQRPFLARVKTAFAMPQQSMAWKGGFAVAACLMIAIIVMENGAATKQTYKKPMTQLVEEMYLNAY